MSTDVSSIDAQAPQTHAFQAQVQEVLDIVIHSLYADKEVFLRELISNASDALEKFRHLRVAQAQEACFDEHLDLQIQVQTDDQAGTLVVQDFGIGMNAAELSENLGQIAHSGSKAFLASLKEAGDSGHDLIGRFGVGFYSVFMVADQVKVYTHSYRPEDPGLCWSSAGKGTYTIEAAPGQRRGTRVVLQLKEEFRELVRAERVKSIIHKYSNFVPFPVYVNGERINTVEALWLKQKSQVTAEQYREFFKFQAHRTEEPLGWLHFSADAPLDLHALLFIPSENPERLGLGPMESAVALHCRKVLIDAQPKKLLPSWLRFLTGVIDSADLPLNISRESLQDHNLVQRIGQVLSKRVVKYLEGLVQEDSATYRKFYQTFGYCLKEGVVQDWTHREALAGLLRFESSQPATPDAAAALEEPQWTTFAEYVARMPAEQSEIYFLSGPSRAYLQASPHLEVFRKRGLEVLYCLEAIDEFALNHLGQYQGKRFVCAEGADLNLPEAEVLADPEADPDLKSLREWATQFLGDQVEEVVFSKRLVESPAAVRNAYKGLSLHMQRVLSRMEGKEAENAFVLELNPQHPLIRKLIQTRQQRPDLAALTLQQLLDIALLSAGVLEDKQALVNRFYKLMES